MLAPLYARLEAGASTAHEADFVAAYAADLRSALAHCHEFRLSGDEAQLQAAWTRFYEVLRQLGRQLQQARTLLLLPLRAWTCPGHVHSTSETCVRVCLSLSQARTLQLRDVSPRLLKATNLEIAVPGTYRANAPVVAIRSFAPAIRVMSSKQRPRKLAVTGDDGVEYVFLLKGHEDLRQDERVMQLFGLVNALLASTDDGARLDLGIQRYSVVPLSTNSGLIE